MYQIYAYAYLDRVLIKNLVNGIDLVDTCFLRFFINILGHYKLHKIQGFVLSYNHSLFCLINIHDIIHACIFVLNVKLSLNICRNQIIFNDWNIHLNRLFCSIFWEKIWYLSLAFCLLLTIFWPTKLILGRALSISLNLTHLICAPYFYLISTL